MLPSVQASAVEQIEATGHEAASVHTGTAVPSPNPGPWTAGVPFPALIRMVRHSLAMIRPSGRASEQTVRDVQAIVALPADSPERLARRQAGLERLVLVPVNQLGLGAGKPPPAGAVPVELDVLGFQHIRFAKPATMHTLEQLLEVDGEPRKLKAAWGIAGCVLGTVHLQLDAVCLQARCAMRTVSCKPAAGRR